MRKPDNTIVFNTATEGPTSLGPSSLGPTSLRGPASKAFEKQWFNKPVDLSPNSMPPSSLLGPRRPVGDDLLAERRGFIPKNPERGLAFAAVTLALVGVAAAGTYFFFGLEHTAKQDTPAEVSTTTVTNADVPPPAAAMNPPATTATATSDNNVQWKEPVVDAVKAPGITHDVSGAQAVPTERPSTSTPSTTRSSTSSQGSQDMGSQGQGDMGGDMGSQASTPIPTQPSAGSREATTHMTEDPGTMTNPTGEPVLPNVNVHQ